MSSDIQKAEEAASVIVDGLGKRYEIYAKPQDRLKQMILPRFQRGAGRALKSYYREFWALRDVSFEVRPGEAVGVIGRNGSGKSTLLQIVCGTLQATMGQLRTRGRIAALLELGAGFNPEFTGRENIFLSGLVYGISESDLKARYQQIVDFSEIGEHIDQPVKTYSSGMYVRLAFAVATFCDPDILIVDEALSVGDVYFQRKCFRRIDELRQSGCTLLFVTHSMDTLLQLCDRGLVIDEGRLVFDGDAKPAVAEYLRRVFGTRVARDEDRLAVDGGRAVATGNDREALLASDTSEVFSSRPGYNKDEIRLGNGKARVLDFLVAGQKGESPIIHEGDTFTLMVKYHFSEPVDRVILGIQVRTREGLTAYSANSFTTEGTLHAFGEGVVVCEFTMRNALLPGQYFVTVGTSRFDDHGVEIEAMDRRVDAIILTVVGTSRKAHGLANLELKVKVDEISNGEG